MTATCILADIEVTDPMVYESCRRQVPALIAAHGGRHLLRAGAMQAPGLVLTSVLRRTGACVAPGLCCAGG